MNKKKIEIIITSILGIILVIGAIRLISTGKAKRTPPPAKRKTPPALKVIISEKIARIETEIEKIGWERNPFIRGRISGPSGAASLSLTGIMWDEQNPNAIIGDTVVREGDVIGKYKVIKINKDSVVISSDEGKKVLNIWEGE